MVSEARSVRGGKSPRSLAAKPTGITYCQYPSVDEVRKEAGRKEEAAVQVGRDDGEGLHEPAETIPADLRRQARN
jgi:hypothetical protein